MSDATKRCPRCLTPGAPCGSDDAAMAESACAELAADHEYRREMKAEIETSTLRAQLATALQRATDAEAARVRAEVERDGANRRMLAKFERDEAARALIDDASSGLIAALQSEAAGLMDERDRALADLAAANERANRAEAERDTYRDACDADSAFAAVLGAIDDADRHANMDDARLEVAWATRTIAGLRIALAAATARAERIERETVERCAKVADGIADHNLRRSSSPMDARGLIGGALASTAAEIRALAPAPVDADKETK